MFAFIILCHYPCAFSLSCAMLLPPLLRPRHFLLFLCLRFCHLFRFKYVILFVVFFLRNHNVAWMRLKGGNTSLTFNNWTHSHSHRRTSVYTITFAVALPLPIPLTCLFARIFPMPLLIYSFISPHSHMRATHTTHRWHGLSRTHRLNLLLLQQACGFDSYSSLPHFVFVICGWCFF